MPNKPNDDWRSLPDSLDDPWVVLTAGIVVLVFVAVLGFVVIKLVQAWA